MNKHVVVIGAGIGGLSSALALLADGHRVTLLERHSVPGGRMRECAVGGVGIDSGPTVFTIRPVFDELLARLDTDLGDIVELVRADCLARHSWPDGSRLDLFDDVDRSSAAIADFAGSDEADAYRAFAGRSAEVFKTLDHTFMRSEKPGMASLSFRVGNPMRLLQTRPFTSLWAELGRAFNDPRLRQLFGRYATYCGSSPFDAPATLMLIAHAERAGVWKVRGGMQRLADALARLFSDRGGDLRFDCEVDEIIVERGRAVGVQLRDGSRLSADAIVFNGDVNALSLGLLGSAATHAVADRRREARSLSAMTWSMRATARGFPLYYHTVFFGRDYPAEFDALFRRATVCDEPTVYICAQDRIETTDVDGAERLFLLMNAPPRTLDDTESEVFERRVFSMLERQGLTFDIDDVEITRPQDFAQRFPGSDGAIYGWPTHGWSGSFRRSGSTSKIKGLAFAGGSVHPGPGVPMVARSGLLAAATVSRYLSAN